MKRFTLTLLLIVMLQLVYSQEFFIEVTVFLEGPFNGVDMNTDLKNQDLIPLDQPFNQSPWNYAGTESASSIQSNWVDWVLVELRETAGNAAAATTSTVIARQACLLRSEGFLENASGDWFPIFNLTVTENLYVVIHHRNHLSIMSSMPLSISGDYYEYDFTDELSKAYLHGQKEIAPGVFGMIAGDCDASGVIDMDDQNYCWETTAGEHGYESSDLNLDGETNNIDKDDYWSTNYGIGLHTCGELLVDSRDGQQYETVEIGDQCWMAENLNIGTRVDLSDGQTNNSTHEKFCYNDQEDSCLVYGGLYRWTELMNYSISQGAKGICPTGWHVPTHNEFEILTNSLGGGLVAGGKLKEEGYAHWAPPNSGATNESGFTALPGGESDLISFDYWGYFARFWTSTLYTNQTASLFQLSNIFPSSALDTKFLFPNYGYSVRCLKNYPDPHYPPSQPSNPEPGNGAINIELDTVLSWSSSSSANENIQYKLYFGSDPNPPLLAGNLADTSYSVHLQYDGMTYFWKVEAIGIWGDPAMSDTWSFTTKPFDCTTESIFDYRDGKQYETIKIGDQCWMAENMNIGTITGDANNQANNGIIEKYCYNNEEDSCNTYGGLYQWNETMGYSTQKGVQGICPTGWHLPFNKEYTIMFDYLGGSDIAGGKLKEEGYAHWLPPNNGATNESGFTALPAGERGYAMGFNGVGYNARFWTSDFSSSNSAYRMGLISQLSSTGFTPEYKFRGYSVRCLKNYPHYPPSQPNNPEPGNGAFDIGIDTVLSWTCSDPDGDILYYDIYFGADPNPPIYATSLADTSANLPILEFETTYYWKVKAYDSWGESVESNTWNFTTKTFNCSTDSLFDIRDGQQYETIKIDDQCWMAENINIGNIITSGYQANDGIIEKYCYDNLESNCDTYGGLYMWNELMDYTTSEFAQGICPAGWHLPSDGEWTTLTDQLEGLDLAGGKLKEDGTSHWLSPNTGATNESGFTGLPGGHRNTTGESWNIGQTANFWSSTLSGSNQAWRWYLSHNNDDVTRIGYNNGYKYSARCLKNPSLSLSDPVPANEETGVSIMATLSWLCTYSDEYNITYELYLGTSSNPPLVADNLTESSYSTILELQKTYFWKIKAIDIWGNSVMSSIWSFTTEDNPFTTCGDTMVDTRDGSRYKTKLIGTICWMAENLNIGTIINANTAQTDNDVTEKYCYNNIEDSCSTYGGLYQWDEMMDYNTSGYVYNICPEGWILPSISHWNLLTNYCGGIDVAGGKLKEAGTEHWDSPNTGATNEYGFNALPGGATLNGTFYNLGNRGIYWSSTEDGSNANTRAAWYNNTTITEGTPSQNYGFSVRCLKE